MIRFYLQSTHYRSPIEWNETRLKEAGVAYARLREALAKAGVGETEPAGAGAAGSGPGAPKANRGASSLASEIAELASRFDEAVEDDFNTAKAQGHLFEMAKAINRIADSADAPAAERAALPAAGQTLRQLGLVVGLFWGDASPEEEVPEEVQTLVRARDESRMQKKWKRADELRDEILALGYVLEDSKGGTRARRKA